MMNIDECNNLEKSEDRLKDADRWGDYDLGSISYDAIRFLIEHIKILEKRIEVLENK